MTNRVLAEVCLIAGPVCPLTHLLVTFPVSECIIGINILRSRQNPHIGSLTYGVEGSMFERLNKWKPLELLLPGKIGNKKMVSYPWRNCRT